MRKVMSTRRTWTRGAAVSALALGMATGLPTQASAQPSAPSAEQHAVTQKNLQFNPNDMTITVGDTVTWTNHETDGTTIHSVVQSGGSEINSPDIPQETSFSWTFTQVQDYNIICRFHPDMFMTMHVLDAKAAKGAKGQKGTDKAATKDTKTTKDTKKGGKADKGGKKAPAMDMTHGDAHEESAKKSVPAPAPGPPDSTIPGIAGLPFSREGDIRPGLVR